MRVLENLPKGHLLEEEIPYGYAKKEIILDQLGNPIDWRYLEVNTAFEGYTGIPAKGLIGKSSSEIVSEGGVYFDWLDFYYKAAFHNTAQAFVDWVEPLKKWFSVNISSPQEGQVTIFLQDVTKFEQERRMYADILANISDAVFITDDTGDFTYVSPNTARIFGYTESEFFTLKNIQSLFGKAMLNMTALKKTGTISNIEKCTRTKSGNRLDFLINISKVKVGKGTILFTCREITERLRIEKEREQHAAQLKAFMDAIPDMVWIKDKKGKYISCNNEFEKLYEVSESEIIGKDDFHFLPEDLASFARTQDKEAIETGGLIKNEETLRLKNEHDENIIVEVTKAPVYDSSNEPIGVLGVARDITKRKTIERQMIKTNHDLTLQIQKLHLVMKNYGILAWETDLETSSTEIFPKGNISSTTISDLDGIRKQIKKEHRSYFENKLQALWSGEIEHFTCEFQLMDENTNDWQWYQSDISVLERSDEGFSKRIFGTLLNVNEKKVSEKRQVLSQEQERIRVASDIHDSIGQQLVGTRFMLNQTLEKNVSLERLKELNTTIDKILGDLIHESRLIINNFGISIAENGDLKQTFIELAEKMKKIYKGDICLQWDGENDVNGLLLGVHLFRIYQEALTNAIKYSKSDKIEIEVSNQAEFSMIIRDYGVGFNIDAVASGFGIQNIKDRTKQIGGTMNIDSAIGTGTTVQFTI